MEGGMKNLWITVLGGIILISGACSSGTKPSKKVVKPVKPKPVVVEQKIDHTRIAKLFVFPGGKMKAVIMSFDDGPDQDKRLIEIFNKYGIKGTFHLNSGKFAGKSKAALDTMKAYYSGHEVSVHTVSHPHLEFLSGDQVKKEILDDQAKLESVFGYPVNGMSYPFGTYSQLVLDLLPSLSILYSRTVGMDTSFKLPKNLLAWDPTCHSGSADYWIKKFTGTNKNEMMLLFIWGHAWEFDNGDKDKNWAAIENICAALAQEKDIWFASAMEAAEYIEAAQSVVEKNTGAVLTNVSPIVLWVKTPKGVVQLKPGKTLPNPSIE